jgi:hypothetical protein
VIDLGSDRAVCIRPDGEGETADRAEKFALALDDPHTVLLLDCSVNRQPVAGRAKMLVTSSPNRDRYKDFTNQVCRKLYMPLWSFEELELCRAECFPAIPAAALVERFTQWGGVARWTIGDTDDSAGAMQEALGNMDFDRAVSAVGAKDGIDPKGHSLTHRLIHAEVSAEFMSWTFKFASPFVLEAVLQKCATDAEEKCRSFLATMTDSVYAALRGQVFEAYAHRLLSTTDKLVGVRDLATNALSDVTLGPRSRADFVAVEKVTDKQYGVPRSHTFAVLDAVAPPDVGFQMTVSRDHGILVQPMTKILAALPQLKQIIFVVPQTIANDYPRQKLLTKEGKVWSAALPSGIANIQQAVFGIDLARQSV